MLEPIQCIASLASLTLRNFGVFDYCFAAITIKGAPWGEKEGMMVIAVLKVET